MDEQVFRVVLWVAGILVTCLIGLVAYVWKTGQAELRSLKTIIEQQAQSIDDIDKRVVAIETKCKAHDSLIPLSGQDIRSIIREEFETFRESFKLSLLEQGYIKQQQPKTKTAKR